MKELDIQVRTRRRSGRYGTAAASGGSSSSSPAAVCDSGLADAVKTLGSYWTLDDDGNLFTTFPVYSTSTVTALGKGDEESGGSGVDAATVTTIVAAYLDGHAYATEDWVRDNVTSYTITRDDVESVLTGNVSTHTHAALSYRRKLWGQWFQGDSDVDGSITVKDRDGNIRAVVCDWGAFELRNQLGKRIALQMVGDHKLRLWHSDDSAGNVAADLTVYAARCNVEIDPGYGLICGDALLRYDPDRDAWITNKSIITEGTLSCLDKE